MDDLVRLLHAVQPYRDSSLATEPICGAIALPVTGSTRS